MDFSDQDFYFGLVMWRHKAVPRSRVCDSDEERCVSLII